MLSPAKQKVAWLIPSEMQIKTTMRYHFSPIRRGITKKKKKQNKKKKQSRKQQVLARVGQLPWKTAQEFLKKKLNID